MTEQTRIYIDNAATSWPKPESVYSAIEQQMRVNGMPLGRTTSEFAEQTSRVVQQLRLKIRRLASATDAATLFCFNGTDALNLAIHGTLHPGDHVVTTSAEHNSVLRPLRFLEESGIITVSRVECDSFGQVEPKKVLDAMQGNTRLVALTHCSNVTGVPNDIEAVGTGITSSEVLFLVDAAQTFGCRRVDFDASGIDFLAFSGHKSLMGPLGTGALVVSSKGQGRLRPIRQGGTGASSDSDRHPIDFPEGYEAGNPNVPGLIGLNAGIDYLLEKGLDEIQSHKKKLAGLFAELISSAKDVELIAGKKGHESGIVSFNLPIHASELAVILDSNYGIQIRAGFHCASLIHSRIGTPHGCARASFGAFNSEDDATNAARAIKEVADAL